MAKKTTSEILEILKKNPVIPCTSHYDELLKEEYAQNKLSLVYDISIFDLIKIAKKKNDAKKEIILNLDTLKGLSSDDYGIKFIHDYLKIKILSTASPRIINLLKKTDITIVQSMFILDTKSLKKGLQLVKAGKPDFLDIRPGILYPKTSGLIREELGDIPIICSGFINNKPELEKILSFGAKAVTTSTQDLWTLYTR